MKCLYITAYNATRAKTDYKNTVNRNGLRSFVCGILVESVTSYIDYEGMTLLLNNLRGCMVCLSMFIMLGCILFN